MDRNRLFPDEQSSDDRYFFKATDPAIKHNKGETTEDFPDWWYVRSSGFDAACYGPGITLKPGTWMAKWEIEVALVPLSVPFSEDRPSRDKFNMHSTVCVMDVVAKNGLLILDPGQLITCEFVEQHPESTFRGNLTAYFKLENETPLVEVRLFTSNTLFAFFFAKDLEIKRVGELPT
jgi:hypothetical protein